MLGITPSMSPNNISRKAYLNTQPSFDDFFPYFRGNINYMSQPFRLERKQRLQFSVAVCRFAEMAREVQSSSLDSRKGGCEGMDVPCLRSVSACVKT
jgi:hypothetical protein